MLKFHCCVEYIHSMGDLLEPNSLQSQTEKRKYLEWQQFDCFNSVVFASSLLIGVQYLRCKTGEYLQPEGLLVSNIFAQSISVHHPDHPQHHFSGFFVNMKSSLFKI